MVYVSLGAANHDETRFERPEEFDIFREPKQHLAFALGAHSCLGLHLAQMETRVVPTRFKEGDGPVGMWFQYFHAHVTNALGEDYTVTQADELKKYEPYGSAVPTPTPLRNHQMFLDIKDGLGPMLMRTDEAMQALAGGDPAKMDKVRDEAWEDFLDMTIAQALTLAAQNIAPDETASEVVLAAAVEAA